MGPYQTLTVETSGRVAVVTFRRADQLNAMNRLMQGEITEAFEALSGDAGRRCDRGDRRGARLHGRRRHQGIRRADAAEFDAFQAAGTRMYAAIEDNRKPVIAAVNGFALGGGMELVLCCDIVIANQFAKLGLPEIKLGLIPGGGGTQRSVAKLGRNRANFLLMTGAIVPASEFIDAGLVNEIVDVDRLMPRARELAADDRRRARRRDRRPEAADRACACRAVWPTASPWSAIVWAASTAARSASGACANSPSEAAPSRPRPTRHAARHEQPNAAGGRHEAFPGQAEPAPVHRCRGIGRDGRDGDVFGVGGHHFARLPIALLAPSRRRRQGPALRLLGRRAAARTAARGGCGRRASTSASPASTFSACRRVSAPLPRRAVPVRDWTALAMIQALRAAQQNLPSMPFQLRPAPTCWTRVPGAARSPIRFPGAGSGGPAAAARHVRRSTRRVPTRAATSRSSGRGRWTRHGRRGAAGAGHGRGDRAGRARCAMTAARASSPAIRFPPSRGRRAAPIRPPACHSTSRTIGAVGGLRGRERRLRGRSAACLPEGVPARCSMLRRSARTTRIAMSGGHGWRPKQASIDEIIGDPHRRRTRQ